MTGRLRGLQDDSMAYDRTSAGAIRRQHGLRQDVCEGYKTTAWPTTGRLRGLQDDSMGYKALTGAIIRRLPSFIGYIYYRESLRPCHPF